MSRAKGCNTIDLSITHLTAVRNRARAIIEAVASGEHPVKLGGVSLTSTSNTVISLPVGLRYRLLFNAKTLEPIDFLTHEDYNKSLKGRLK
jgi:hypothetical protein